MFRNFNNCVLISFESYDYYRNFFFPVIKNCGNKFVKVRYSKKKIRLFNTYEPGVFFNNRKRQGRDVLARA